MSGPIRSALMTAKNVNLNRAPSKAQKAAGNYKKHHVRIHGLDIALENMKGGKRSGIGKDGRRWAVSMPAHYGYIKRTEGADGDHVDVYVGPDHASQHVYVIDQKDAHTGKFDEHKVMLGFNSEDQARATYIKGFSDGKGAQRIQSINPMSIDQFKDWLKHGNTAKRVGRSFGGRLELNRAKEAKKRAPGQVSPSKYMPDVPRQVRADGGPLRLYHGTEVSHPIDELDPFISPDQLGIHLGDAATANRFAKRTNYDPKTNAMMAPRVIPVNAKFKNPLRLRDTWGTWEPSKIYEQLVENGIMNEDPDMIDSLMNREQGMTEDGRDPRSERKAKQLQRSAVESIHGLLRQLGHDSIVYLNRYEMPTDEAKARLDNHPLPRGKLNDMSDEEFKKEFPEAVDSYIALSPGQLESPFGKGPGVGYADGGDVDDQNQQEPVGIRAYHGSPHDFDKFDISKIGTGEGAQAYGHGLYFAESEPVALGYRRALSGPESMGTVTFDGRPLVSKGSPAEGWDDPELYLSEGIHARDLAETMLRHSGDVDAAVAELRSKSQSGLERAQTIKNEKLRQVAANSAKTASDMADFLQTNANRYGVKVPGHMYEVNINADPNQFLDWDKPLSEQPESVLSVARTFFSEGIPERNKYNETLKGSDLYDMLVQRAGGIMHSPKLDKAGIPSSLPGGTKERMGLYLSNQGIPGIKYLDAGSRGAGEGTRNYVVFNDKLVNIRRKYARGGSIGRAGAHPALQIPGVHVREEEHGTPIFMNRKAKADGGDVEGGLDQFFGPTNQSLRRRYYTGTSKDKDFTAFQESRHGTWLTSDPKEASDYAEQNDSQGYRPGPGWTYEKTNTASRVIPAYVRVENPYTGELPDFARVDNYKKAQSDWFDTLRRKGHDAWVPASSEGRLVVKLTNQGTHIKSAIGNSGAYNLSKKHLAKAEGGEVEDPTPDIANPMSIFPKPQRMFPEDARPPGGQYLAMPDKRDVTGHKAAAATIGVQPGGKPFFRASQDAVEQTGSTGRGTAMARANLFKQKAGWKWLNAPEEHGNTDTIVSVEHRGKHHYALNAHFPKGVDLARYENSPSEPRLRPTTTGNVELGPQAGSILVRGKEHPVYRHVIVKEAGGLVAPRYEDPAKLAKKALMAAKKTGSRS